MPPPYGWGRRSPGPLLGTEGPPQTPPLFFCFEQPGRFQAGSTIFWPCGPRWVWLGFFGRPPGPGFCVCFFSGVFGPGQTKAARKRGLVGPPAPGGAPFWGCGWGFAAGKGAMTPAQPPANPQAPRVPAPAPPPVFLPPEMKEPGAIFQTKLFTYPLPPPTPLPPGCLKTLNFCHRGAFDSHGWRWVAARGLVRPQIPGPFPFPRGWIPGRPLDYF